ncbi:MAG: beta-phosphoglucomutase-like phosphatase (HAD superfamily) [Desulforhopalus sp.]|jgi:beta-phosphoglucomutase-like phosphatase (HAD superfamily)
MLSKTDPTIKAVFWDIDGTLIDSEELHYQVIADWCADHGFPLKKDDNDALLGKSMVEKWEILSGKYSLDSDASTFKRECAKRYCTAVSKDLERGELTAIFRAVAKTKIPQACVSNGDMVVVEANLTVMDLSGMVAFNISGDDVKNGKPDPEPYLAAASKLGVLPAQCLVVEDSVVGVAAAVAAGMTVVAWPEENTPHENYREADYFVTCLAEFPRHLLPI